MTPMRLTSITRLLAHAIRDCLSGSMVGFSLSRATAFFGQVTEFSGSGAYLAKAPSGPAAWVDTVNFTA